MPSKSRSKIYPQRLCSTCWAAATVRRIVTPTPSGASLDQLRWAGPAQTICDDVHDHITFGYEYSRAMRMAVEAFEEKRGVCRDYAHLALAF